jgi:holliday junction DNA helicase RuvB
MDNDEPNDRGESDIDALTPTSLAHIVGQPRVVEPLKVAVEAAHQDHRKLDDVLLLGPPGLGKSTIASVLAKEMASNIHEVLAQSVADQSDLSAVLLRARDGDIVHIDEAHELPKRRQTALNLAVDRRTIAVWWGATILDVPIANFTLVLSSTDEFRLIQPLRDRMKLALHFSFYSTDELVRLLSHRCRSLRWNVDPDVLAGIAQRAHGTPRLALRLLEACRRVTRSAGESEIRMSDFQTACNLEQIDELGLGPNENRYLDLLRAGGSRLNVLASTLGLPPRSVSEVLEPMLIRAGLILKDDRGRRHLTTAGREHAAKLCRGGV